MNTETIVLKDLFDELNIHDIRYVVLRNYETLPWSLQGSDLDLLVSKDCYERTYNIVKEVARIHGGICISYIDDYKVTVINSRFCGRDNTTLGWWGLPIDLFATIGIRQFEYFDTDSIFENRIRTNDIYIAPANDAAIIAFFKECLLNGQIDNKYETDARVAYVSNEMKYEQMFHHYFGSSVAHLWHRYFTSKKKAGSFFGIAERTRWAMIIKSFLRDPYHTTVNTFISIYKRCLRIFRPPGSIIAIIGTDGSGKSTIIQEIEPILESALHKKPQYNHLRPNFLPSLATLFGQNSPVGPVTNPHASKPSGFLGSMVRLLYYTADYILGYWCKVYPTKIRKQNVYIFDRYYYDYLIDPKRSRINLPNWIIKVIALLIPKPDVVLCLGTDPAIIHKRKPELSLAEVERQVAELRHFCKKNKNAFWIDTGCSIKESVNRTLDVIVSKMAKRYE